jgi:hypothetical protein
MALTATSPPSAIVATLGGGFFFLVSYTMKWTYDDVPQRGM